MRELSEVKCRIAETDANMRVPLSARAKLRIIDIIDDERSPLHLGMQNSDDNSISNKKYRLK